MTVDGTLAGNELTFRLWLNLAAQFRTRPLDIGCIARAASAYPDAIVYVRRLDGGGLSGDICLWSGEAYARSCCIQARPSVSSNIVRSKGEMVPVLLRDVFTDEKLIEGLRDRLGSLIHYDPDLLPDLPTWTWHFQSFSHSNLLIEDGRLVVPPDWKSKDGRFAELDPYRSSIRIIDDRGRMGLMANTGDVLIPCSFAYLALPRCGDDRVFEADAESIPEPWAPCDLVDMHGGKLNPPGTKLRAGTLAGDLVIVHPDTETEHGLTGYMTTAGELLGGRRWKSLRMFNEDRSAVQDPETGLWGFIDKQGNLAVVPRFTRAQSFDHGYAAVATPESGELLGLIDMAGALVVEPVWRELDWLLGKYFMATDRDSALGLIDNRGNVIIEPYYPSHEEDAEIDKARGAIRSHPFVRKLGEWLRKKVQSTIPPDGSLAPLAGLFSQANASDLEILSSELWAREVELIADYKVPAMNTPLSAGSTGTIGWQYPVSASTFDLSVEAPVRGLPPLPHASIGVPWQMLRFS